MVVKHLLDNLLHTEHKQKVTNALHAGLCSSVDRASDSRARGLGFDTRSGHMLSFLLMLIQEGQLSVIGEKYVH